MSRFLLFLAGLPVMAAMANTPAQAELPCVPNPQRLLGNSYIPEATFDLVLEPALP